VQSLTGISSSHQKIKIMLLLGIMHRTGWRRYGGTGGDAVMADIADVQNKALFQLRLSLNALTISEVGDSRNLTNCNGTHSFFT
jgi:hypothetical protein